MIHMKCQILFFLKNKKINFRMSSATNLPNALRVKATFKIVKGVVFIYIYIEREREGEREREREREILTLLLTSLGKTILLGVLFFYSEL